MSYQFFSEADIDKNTGKVKSEYPIWYNPKLIQEIEDEVVSKEIALKTGQVPQGYESEYRENLSRLKDQLKTVQNMTLVDDAKNDHAKLGDALKDLATILKSEMPSNKLCERNLVDPNQEYQKITKQYIPVKDDNMAELARACNVPIVDGKISRGGIEKMWKIGTKYLGDYANVEVLRKM